MQYKIIMLRMTVWRMPKPESIGYFFVSLSGAVRREIARRLISARIHSLSGVASSYGASSKAGAGVLESCCPPQVGLAFPEYDRPPEGIFLNGESPLPLLKRLAYRRAAASLCPGVRSAFSCHDLSSVKWLAAAPCRCRWRPES